MNIDGKQPNFLIITTDEERFPPTYENPEAKEYRLKNSESLMQMREHGIEFVNHNAASTACAPSRTSIYTGQYPSLHGVSQTPGIGKSSFDQNMFWLEPNTVPTMGSWFREAGYQTYYRGKWHLSDEDILVPGTQQALVSNSISGAAYPQRISLYKQANRLDKFGFNQWIGPEPHGAAENNCGTVRDPGFAKQVCETLLMLDKQAQQGDNQPFLLVSSFVNPHDIVLPRQPEWFEEFYQQKEAGLLPTVDPAPSQSESLQSKPRCQKDYLYTYPHMYLPQPTTEGYRQFYYYLMAEVNKHITSVYETLKQTSLFDNTIVVFTSDHGELLGAHGGLHQKWYSAYQEVLNVPFIVSNPNLFKQSGQLDVTTSHVDLLPTLLGLANVDTESIRQKLSESHSEARPLVGRDLSKILLGEQSPNDEPIYFMTDDNVEVGSDMTNPATGVPYNSIIQPNHIEAIVTKLPELTGDTRWKYVRYFDNARFYSDTGFLDGLEDDNQNIGRQDSRYDLSHLVASGNPDDVTTTRFIPSEFECYNLSDDPTEEHNLLSPLCPTPVDESVLTALKMVMKEQRLKKRLLPHNTNKEVEGKPSEGTPIIPLRR
ncbi:MULTISPECIES: sulfatase-like hydrolase/transferase [Pseudoalteromonas]|uniref:Sulfatase n=1 Tax=Pseudoalteromonas amylolytica TaxID=1859457 RepID=A0A1S1MX84_9GAMM|nr:MULTISPECIES: sulfatase-like hydrolase/transferase [Pseudoalteromonas]OHU88637.1 sulfatase [Pseudoalteromonas sp. JW3]OHU90480.1 sulfatase [Pseudoalteromonas amylolytica]